MAQSGGARGNSFPDCFNKNVMLLKNGDFRRINGQVYHPTSSEISLLRRRAEPAQFKSVQFAKSMSREAVREKLEQTFPYLENKRFSCCAAVKVDKESRRFEFNGSPRVWDGETIKKNIRGNSSLYILEEEVTQPTSTVTHDITTADLNPGEHSELVGGQARLYQDYHISEMLQLGPSAMEVDDNVFHTNEALVPNLQNPMIHAIASTSEQGHPSSPSSTREETMALTGQLTNLSTVTAAYGAQAEWCGTYSSSSEDTFPTSGISEGDFVLTEEDLSPDHWRREGDEQIQVSITPNRVPLKGGLMCHFTFSPRIPARVQSGTAEVVNLDIVEVNRFKDNSMIGMKIPPSPDPGWVTVILKSQYGIKLGETRVEYVDEEKEFLQKVVQDPKLQLRLFSEWTKTLGGNSESKESETQNAGNLEYNQQIQVLRLLVYAAAESGAQQFIEMIFTSSAARVVFDAYKDSSPLPEVIARTCGHEETANYLQDISTRFTKERANCSEEGQTINWLELVAAAEAAQEQRGLNVASEQENRGLKNDNTKDTDYFGDAETSTSSFNSSKLSTSDSYDDVRDIFLEGDQTISLLNTDTSQCLVNSTGTLPSQENQEYDRVSEENVIRDSEHIHGSYCLYRQTDLLFVDGEGEWKPKPIKGIVISKGDEEFQWSIESFFQSLDIFSDEMDKESNLCKQQMEQFILLVILPHLEQSWSKCSSTNEKVYKHLANLSCSINSEIVVGCALQLLFHLISKDNFASGEFNLLVVEEIVRSSIFSSDGVLKNNEYSEQNLKVFLYSRILSLILIKQLQEVELPVVALKTFLRKVQQQLKRRSGQIKSQKKDRFRYSVEFILETIPYLLKLHEAAKIRRSVEECQEFCRNSQIKANDLKILHALRKKNGKWNDLHYILIHLHGKVHSQHPVPQMHTERRAMKLIRLIVEANLRGGGGTDWRFCLLASSVLVDITMNNVTKEIRKEAGGCLLNLLQDAKVQKRPDCRALLEPISAEVMLCPDMENRTFLVHFFSKKLQLQDALPAYLHTDHLSSAYTTQRLKIYETNISKNARCFINYGTFQTQKVAVKILYIKTQHLLEHDPLYQARERFIREVYNMRRLNASHHPNFPLLLGYDAKSLPYHLITKFERWGNLLQFVRMSREQYPPVPPNQLLKMLKDISDALLFLEESSLVHRAVMAENVRVGDGFVCKLSGLHSLEQLTNKPSDKDSASFYDYCSVEVPNFIATPNDDDLPVRWKAPECLTEHRYSTASDVWAFGVLMYEVLTHGCIPYKHILNDEEVASHVMECKEVVPLEMCFEDTENELIKKCCEWQFQRRLELSEVNKRLKKILQLADYKLQSIEENEGLYEEIRDDLVKKVESLAMEGEKLSLEEDENLRRLLALNHPNLASILQVHHLDSHYSIISPDYPNGNLKEYVLDRRCKQEDIVTFLSQVATAMHYLFANNIIHGDLRAEYVNVVAPDKVQVGRLGRSKLCAYDITSTSRVVRANMPLDSTRWSAPEVISDGLYSHASDIWAFGILTWELYASFTAGQDNRKISVPYHDLSNHEILPYMKHKGPLDRPEGCPDWVYFIMRQCCAFDSAQRPPIIVIIDCLASREPMSWSMKLWLPNHHDGEWPGLSTSQTEEALHAKDVENHPTRTNIEWMCSENFLIRHDYSHVDLYEDSRGNYSSLRRSKVDEIFYCSPEYRESSSYESAPHNSCPLTLDAVKSDRLKHRFSCEENDEDYLYINVVGCGKQNITRYHNGICQAEKSCRTRKDSRCSEVKDTTCSSENQNETSSLDQDKSSQNEGTTQLDENQNTVCQLHENEDSLNDDSIGLLRQGSLRRSESQETLQFIHDQAVKLPCESTASITNPGSFKLQEKADKQYQDQDFSTYDEPARYIRVRYTRKAPKHVQNHGSLNENKGPNSKNQFENKNIFAMDDLLKREHASPIDNEYV